MKNTVAIASYFVFFIFSLWIINWLTYWPLSYHCSKKINSNINTLTACLSVFPSDLLTLLYHEQISHFERTVVLEGKTHFITTALISNPALVCARRVFLPGIFSQDLWDHSHRKCAPLGFSHAAIQSRPEIPSRSPLLARVIVGRYFSPLPHNPIPVNSCSDSSGRISGPEKSLLSIIPAFHTPPH